VARDEGQKATEPGASGRCSLQVGWIWTTAIHKVAPDIWIQAATLAQNQRDAIAILNACEMDGDIQPT